MYGSSFAHFKPESKYQGKEVYLDFQKIDALCKFLIHHIADFTADIFELGAILALIFGAFWIIPTIIRNPHFPPGQQAIKQFRKILGYSLLIGLDLMVGSDIIRSIAVAPTLFDVSTLGLIVLIRIMLSWSIEQQQKKLP